MSRIRITGMMGCVLLLVAAIVDVAGAVNYGGVEFPLGAVSFADSVTSFSLGPGTAPPYNDPATTLGVPDYVPRPTGQNDNTYAMGNVGSLVLEFVDNRLVDQDAAQSGLDLYIYEAGGAVEPFVVEISKDGSSFISLGTLIGQPTGIDIKPFVSPGDVFRFVRIVDANSRASGSPFAGADIDAVGANGSILPEPGCLLSWLGFTMIVAARPLTAIARRRVVPRSWNSGRPRR